MTEMIAMLIDTELRRPGCVLLQAVAGGHQGEHFIQFNPDSWLTFPTEHMVLMHGTTEQWKQFAEEVNSKSYR